MQISRQEFCDKNINHYIYFLSTIILSSKEQLNFNEIIPFPAIHLGEILTHRYKQCVEIFTQYCL